MEWWEKRASLGTAVGGPTTIVALYRWAKAQGRADVLTERGVETVKAKNEEIDQVKGALSDCTAENKRLWLLIETLQQGRRP